MHQPPDDRPTYHPSANISKELSHAEKSQGIIIFDKDYARSVYNLVSPALRESIEKINPKYFTYNCKTLERYCEPDVQDRRLRLSFWNEYQETQRTFKVSMSLKNVINGICSQGYFWDVVVKDPKKLAWILYPPVDYEKAAKEILDFGMEEMREVLGMPIVTKVKKVVKDKSGRVVKDDDGNILYEEKEEINFNLIKEKIKIFALMDNRVKGQTVQRLKIEQETRSVNLNVSSNQEAPKSMEQIERELSALEKKIDKSSYRELGSNIIDVTPNESPDEQ